MLAVGIASAAGCAEPPSTTPRDASMDAPAGRDAPAPDAPAPDPDTSAPDATDEGPAADLPTGDSVAHDAASDAASHDLPETNDAGASDVAAPLDRPVVDADVDAAVDVARPPDAVAGDSGAPGAWERVGDFANGLWQWGHLVAIAPDGTAYVGRVNTGVYRGARRDGRYTFTLLPNAGLTNLGLSALTVNARGEPLVGCAAPMYGGTGPGTLFRFHPDTNVWSTATVPAPGYTRNVTDFYRAPDGSIYVTGGWAARLLRSTDHGSTYTVRFNFDAVRPGTYYGLLFSVEVGPGNEMVIGAETESFQHSFDLGATFTPLDAATWLQRGNPYGTGFTSRGEGLFSRARDADPAKVYRRDPTRGWVRADTGLDSDPINTAPANGWIHSIVLAPWGENFIATLASIYRARDGGPWVPFMTGIDTAVYGPYPNVIAADGSCVYAVTRPVAPRSDIGALYRYCGR